MTLPTYRSRTGAVLAEQAALDDIARCSRILRRLRLLTIAFQQYPRAVELLDDITQTVIAIKHDAQRRQREANEQI